MRKSGTVHVSVNVDIEDVIWEISDAQLYAALEERKLPRPDTSDASELLAEAYERLIQGDYAAAQLCLERSLFPKWSTVKSCHDAYQKLKTKEPAP